MFSASIRCVNPSCLGCTCATSPVGYRCPGARTAVGSSELDAPERSRRDDGRVGRDEVLVFFCTERSRTSENLIFISEYLPTVTVRVDMCDLQSKDIDMLGVR